MLAPVREPQAGVSQSVLCVQRQGTLELGDRTVSILGLIPPAQVP